MISVDMVRDVKLEMKNIYLYIYACYDLDGKDHNMHGYGYTFIRSRVRSQPV